MKKNICIIILLILVVGLGGYITYDKVLKKDDTKKNIKDVENNENINKDIKELYSFIQTDIIGKLDVDDGEIEEMDGFEKYFKNVEYFSKDYNIQFKYPVINIDSNTVKNINNNIKTNVEKLEKEYKTINEKTEDDIFKITLKDGIHYNKNFLQYYKYFVNESDKYISVVEILAFASIYSGASDEIKNVYVIDKKSGNLITNNELLNEYNLNNDQILEFIAKKYNEFDKGNNFTKEDFKNGNLDSEYIYYYINNNKLHILINTSDFSESLMYYDFEYEKN